MVDDATDRVLGMHMVGADAGEVIQGFAAALLAKAQSLRDRYRQHELELSELVGFIAYEVITDHILKEDLKFALKERVPATA